MPVPSQDSKARFIEPMLLLAAETLPEGAGWAYELKLDGYRALGIKTGGTVRLRSRNDKDFNRKYPGVAKALAALPDETLVDGEVVALDLAGRPSFNALQNGATGAAIFFYVFDVMVLAGRNVVGGAAGDAEGFALPRGAARARRAGPGSAQVRRGPCRFDRRRPGPGT